MRILILLCYVALLGACRNQPESPVPGNSGLKKNSKYASILAKCEPITIDTLLVYGFEYEEEIPYTDDSVYYKKIAAQRDAYPYRGVDVDTAEAQLFPAEVTQAFMGGGGEIAACYSFAIDEARTAIIARTPAMYESSSIKLFVLNNDKDSITDMVELADVWGDAGDVVIKQSWLYRNNKMNLHAYMWIQESYDHSVEDEKDTTVERNEYHYVLNLSKPQHDTVDRNAGGLLKTFQAVKRN